MNSGRLGIGAHYCDTVQSWNKKKCIQTGLPVDDIIVSQFSARDFGRRMTSCHPAGLALQSLSTSVEMHVMHILKHARQTLGSLDQRAPWR